GRAAAELGVPAEALPRHAFVAARRTTAAAGEERAAAAEDRRADVRERAACGEALGRDGAGEAALPAQRGAAAAGGVVPPLIGHAFLARGTRSAAGRMLTVRAARLDADRRADARVVRIAHDRAARLLRGG